MAVAASAAMAPLDVLPEAAAVHWRPRVDAARLRRDGRLWTLTTVAHVVPFVGAAALLMLLDPLALPVALVCLAHAWVIPELYAQRGANVLRPRGAGARADRDGGPAERRAVGLLGDLVGHDARELHARTGLVLEPGRLGTWLVGEAGAVLLHGRAGGRTATASGRPAPRGRASCRPATASPICCSPCARRGGLRHGRQPRVLRRALAPAPAHARPRCARARCAPLRASGQRGRAARCLNPGQRANAGAARGTR